MTPANFQNKSLHEAEARTSRIALYRSAEWLTSGALLARSPPAASAQSLQTLSSSKSYFVALLKPHEIFL